MRFFSTLVASVLGTFIALGVMVFFVVLMFVGLAASSNPEPPVLNNSTLVFRFEGALPEYVAVDPLAAAFGEQARLDLTQFEDVMRRAAVDDRIDAVVIELERGGGGWASLERMHTALSAVKAAGKPVYAWGTGPILDESVFYLASAADSIFLPYETLVEFNGFSSQMMYFGDALDRLDIEVTAIRQGTYKSAVETFTQDGPSAASREQTQALLTSRRAYFVEAIAAGRSLDAGAVDQALRSGDIVTGEAAGELGLIDEVIYAKTFWDRVAARTGREEGGVRVLQASAYQNVSDRGLNLPERNSDERIAIVYVEGAIQAGSTDQDSDPFATSGDATGSETFLRAMAQARTDDRVKAVVVRVNSPGGTVHAAEAMWKSIQDAREEKPVVISFGDVAASGGYWIATAGDAIVASPQTITGSIGVFSMMINVSKALDNRLGIDIHEEASDPHAGMWSGTRALSAEEQQWLAAQGDITYQRFLKRVADARGMTISDVDQVAQGRVWSGEDALSRGLVDVLGGLDTALNMAAIRAGIDAKSATIVRLPKKKTLLEALSSRMEGASAQLAQLGRSPERIAVDEGLQTLSAIRSHHGRPMARMPYTPIIR